MDAVGRSHSPIGVCVLPGLPPNAGCTTSYPEYVHEILAHAGFFYRTVPLEDLCDSLPVLRILVTVGDGTLPAELLERVRAWLEEGGSWLAVGGSGIEATMFGVRLEEPEFGSWGGGAGMLGEGYLQPRGGLHPATAHLERLLGDEDPPGLHFFNGRPLIAEEGSVLAGIRDAHGKSGHRAGLVERKCGKGRCLVIAPDLTGTVVRIQQGTAVTRDGVPAPDDTAPVADGVLKSDDGAVLDWMFDRRPVDGSPGFRAFLQPIADRWRELLLRSILYLASRQGTALPVLWYYPRDLPALAHLSHDTDGNHPPDAWQLLNVLEAGQVSSTWCVILPGYPPDLMGAIRNAGHELAMHFDAMSEDSRFSEKELDGQWRQLTDLFDGPPVTNKNHYLRWEGDTEFFDWLASRGVQIDQSKGASKTGEAGFNFGTCHPYFPVAPDGRRIDVLELATPTQDLVVFAPETLLEPLLDAAVGSDGVCHLLFHPAHIQKPGVAAALLNAVSRGRDRGLEWWTAARINNWERARRQISCTRFDSDPDSMRIELTGVDELPDEPTLLVLQGAGPQTLTVNQRHCEWRTVERWGFSFRRVSGMGGSDSIP